MKIEPEGVKVLVLPDAVPDKTDGGIWRPDTTKDDEQYAVTRGTIVKLGPDAELSFEGKPLMEQDHVVYAKYGGFIIEDDDTKTKYRLLNDEDILARIS